MKDEQFEHEPRAVVLGGTGFVGEAFAKYWANSAARPSRYLVHRSRPEWLDSSGMEINNISLNDPAQVLSALRGHDVLINLLRPDGSGWYRGAMESLKSVFRESGISRCIHASSIDVYAGVKDHLVDENTQPQPLSAYETEHLAVEAVMRDSFPETLVLRLGAVFGRGGRNLVGLAEEMRRAPQWKIALRRSLYGARRMHLVSVETAARALVQLSLDRKRLGSQSVLVTDDHDPDNNFAFVQDRLAAAFRRDLPRIGPTAPKSLLRVLLRLRGLPDRNIDRRFSHKRAFEMGLPSEPFADRLEKYAQHLSEQMGRYGG
ncbi:NAD(P)-dependent oxidoreductase [Mesorhizobium sp.]|uniref:NAD-dependent epimerase/dehydratase family protein n=1 Tax=Mesorhizobium sp. TaxID=1871066 RepID=UPI000FE89DA8|nr:NAD-dependent epimerase/dehydratase family protein [Mesorhizobium sp.]RWM29468.1 MAG: NAD-dependent epimerase/dehydratase family protein [Mesorhizobium sp.]RWM42389.1 MAG: NAD-dependent epimerase/dehydratase family protein [Mesorhizobium sp.]TJV52848.1 MAG: NAD-dependent epimerase/dehydratase family protein [Mesorhizobium sp.]